MNHVEDIKGSLFRFMKTTDDFACTIRLKQTLMGYCKPLPPWTSADHAFRS